MMVRVGKKKKDYSINFEEEEEDEMEEMEEESEEEKKRQRFSIGNLFYKGSQKLRNMKGSSEENTEELTEEDQQNVSDENIQEEELNQPDGDQRPLSMKDQDQMLSELKKENFDLKLRLYMTQKNSESAEGKVSDYEQQLAALLNSLEERQTAAERQQQDLAETRMREKELLAKQRRLEEKCKEQNEEIHNLSLNLSKASVSTSDLSGATRHSTPLRNATSAYFHGKNDEEESEDDSDVRPLHELRNSSTPRKTVSASSFNRDDDSLLKHDRGVHTSVSDTYNTYKTNNTYLDKNNHHGAFDNVGVVKPNNTRTVVDVEFPEQQTAPPTAVKKKKKGIARVFKLCTGKSGQPVARQDSMYHKRPQARVTVDTAITEG